MALYEGETLAARPHARPIPAAEAVAIARQLGEGLAHAHAAGVIIAM